MHECTYIYIYIYASMELWKKEKERDDREKIRQKKKRKRLLAKSQTSCHCAAKKKTSWSIRINVDINGRGSRIGNGRFGTTGTLLVFIPKNSKSHDGNVIWSVDAKRQRQSAKKRAPVDKIYANLTERVAGRRGGGAKKKCNTAADKLGRRICANENNIIPLNRVFLFAKLGW